MVPLTGSAYAYAQVLAQKVGLRHPNFTMSGAMQGYAYITFEQGNADRAPRQAAVLPCTREDERWHVAGINGRERSNACPFSLGSCSEAPPQVEVRSVAARRKPHLLCFSPFSDAAPPSSLSLPDSRLL